MGTEGCHGQHLSLSLSGSANLGEFCGYSAAQSTFTNPQAPFCVQGIEIADQQALLLLTEGLCRR
jgi:hypothetical protein